jgi:hypothetical protein
MEIKPERHRLVIELGRAIARLGLTSLPTPPQTHRLLSLTSQAPLQTWLHSCLHSLLQDKLDGLPVLLILNTNAEREPARTIVHELFVKFGAGMVEYLPAVAMPLSLTGCGSGVCLQAGYSACEVLPVF